MILQVTEATLNSSGSLCPGGCDFVTFNSNICLATHKPDNQ